MQGVKKIRLARSILLLAAPCFVINLCSVNTLDAYFCEKLSACSSVIVEIFLVSFSTTRRIGKIARVPPL